MQGGDIGAVILKSLDLDFDKVLALKSNGKLEIPDIVKDLNHIFHILVNKSLKSLQKNSKKSDVYFNVWNITQPVLQPLAKLYGILQISNHLLSCLPPLKEKCKESHLLVEKIYKIFAIDKLLQYRAEALAEGYYNSLHIDNLEETFNTLCDEVGESSVNVIDAIANEDFIHNSPIGFKDGQAYSRYTEAVEAQINCYTDPSYIQEMVK